MFRWSLRRWLARSYLRAQYHVADRFRPSKNEGHGKVAVFITPGMKPEVALLRARSVLSPKELVQADIYSSTYSRVLPSQDLADPASFLSAPGRPCSKVVIFDSAVKLRRCPYMLAWLSALAESMNGQGGIYLETLTTGEMPPGWFTAEFLREHFPGCTVSQKGRWVCFRSDGAEALPSLDSAYPFLSGLYPHLLEAMGGSQSIDPAVYMFIRGSITAMDYSFAVRPALECLPQDRPLRIVDMGGSYGSFGLELAAYGHHVTVVDICDCWESMWRTLPLPAALNGSFRFRKGDMEDAAMALDSPDAVFFMGSLLMLDRARVPGVLRNVWDRLHPGGVLVVHELPRDCPWITKSSCDERQFTSDELNSCLSENLCEPEYWDMDSGERLSFPLWRGRRILAVCRKPA